MTTAGTVPPTASWQGVRRIYLLLTLLSTAAASLIWGINTLFLLDAGLSNMAAFAANAFFTVGLVVFEVPTGVIADTRGRRASFLLGTATLIASTLAYLAMWRFEGPFWGWALASVAIGLGFAFLSGSVEAWLVDALGATGYDGELDAVFAQGQVVSGAAMLGGSVLGGVVAQVTDLGVPYVIRAVLLAATLAAGAVAMRDLGFDPPTRGRPLEEARRVLRGSLAGGLGDRQVRWLMLAAPFTAGVGIYVFYAMQPYLLELYGDDRAFGVAGLAAALVAGSQMAGGALVPLVRRVARRRTSVLLVGVAVAAVALVVIGATSSFVVALAALVVWSLVVATSRPVRQAYLNGVVSSSQRATVLSFDSLMGSAGGVVAQPGLGRVADVAGYGASYVISGLATVVAIPFLVLARREGAPADVIVRGDRVPKPTVAVPPEQVVSDPRQDRPPV